LKATFALLANSDIHNTVRRLSWEMHLKYRVGTRHVSLPPHISLKQPFHVDDLPGLEEYMGDLAGSIQPFEVRLNDLQIVPVPYDKYTEYGILWINIEETGILRELHNRLNRELSQRFGETSADYDGDAYHFHMTVMMGGQFMEIYRKFKNEIPNSNINMTYTARELAMFVYDEPMGPHGEYLCYRILNLGQT